MKKQKISVVISAYNAQDYIKDCLESALDLSPEIILVDNSSTDQTAAIAKKYGAKIYQRENNPMLNVNKNFGFSKATGDWIICLDSDERLTPELIDEIKSSISTIKSEIEGFWIPRKNIIFGKWIQSDMWWPDYQLRLFRRGKGQFPEKHVHEKLNIDGQTLKLTMPMIHQNYSSISQFLYKMDKIYTEDEVRNILASKKTLLWTDAIRMPIADFLKTFFLQRGYKDGLHGLVLSMLQAFYMEVVFAKVWEKQGFAEYNSKNFLQDINKEFRRLGKEFRYWIITAFTQEKNGPLKKIFYKILRRLS